MPQLLIEMFSEEIPARMQAQAARDLERMARERLAAAGYLPEGIKAFAGPRRLDLHARGDFFGKQFEEKLGHGFTRRSAA